MVHYSKGSPDKLPVYARGLRYHVTLQAVNKTVRLHFQ